MTDAADLRSLARDAYTFGYAMVENYRTLYEQAVDADDSRFTGGFGGFRHYSEPFTPHNTDIVTPNNDTPYSWGWFDLRAEPWVISVPAIDRFYILPFHDLYTVYAGYVSAATTGTAAGTYLLAGPSWNGITPEGFDGVITASTDFVGCLGRTAFTDDDLGELRRIQQSYGATPLHVFQGSAAPAIEPVTWPEWDEAAATDVRFYDYLDHLLRFAPVLAEDRDIRDRMAAAGLDGSGTFRTAALDAAERADFEAGLADGIAHLDDVASRTASSTGLFGTREEMAGAYDQRNVGAKKGLYGLPPAIAWYGGWLVDSAGNRITGETDYTLTFSAEQLPRARFFWSATLYTLPQRLLSANEIDRYSIGDRTPGIRYADDGSLTLYLQHRRPADPVHAANWLPSPEGPFTVIIRAYGGDSDIAEGTYRLPPITPA
ncbi:DUF1254 domain-containing protein [Microbacterium sp. CFBP9034]|uniref:DUF1254 domain-containing protein n=1 Tax=Microbacterium sp. CFBP9034 TaxID=3096540 RepID=UPI002A6A0C92|nr:DUF1254 domain-containing protein [Microbacterium sp. CFBP9034]MDY0910702.1 DUF1254 domain-containing protein [Microbacterium sp. CFBP9034]